MKKLALVFLAGISFATANAQFQFGAKGGLNFATISGSDAGDASTRVNVNLGVYARLPLAEKISLQPELVYSNQGASVNKGSVAYNYINIPVLLRYYAGSGFSIFTGPQVGFLVGAHYKENGNSINVKDLYNSGDFAWAVGIGYKIPATKLGLDARYNFGIANIEDREKTGSTGSIRNGVFQLGVTYTLFSAGR
ncbi:MAG: PorT family protein [Bacteroidetes bacterium]|nr:PorT family protein [Bacteroidota bacterium]